MSFDGLFITIKTYIYNWKDQGQDLLKLCVCVCVWEKLANRASLMQAFHGSLGYHQCAAKRSICIQGKLSGLDNEALQPWEAPYTSLGAQTSERVRG